jgi:hypothetical protein
MVKRSGIIKESEQKLKLCAVAKIDLNGRFVYVDAEIEKLLGVDCADLYGRGIKSYVDARAYRLILSTLNNSRRYESQFEAGQMTFINVDKTQITRRVVMSLNFIAGNPANYQIIVLPSGDQTERQETIESPRLNLDGAIFEYLATLESDFDLEDFLTIFMKIDEIVQVGFYTLPNGKPMLLGSCCQPSYLGKEMTLSEMDKDYIERAADGVVHITNGSGKYDGVTEISIPLRYSKISWGILRIFYSGDYKSIGDDLETVARFIGNTLYQFCINKTTASE